MCRNIQHIASYTGFHWSTCRRRYQRYLEGLMSFDELMSESPLPKGLGKNFEAYVFTYKTGLCKGSYWRRKRKINKGLMRADELMSMSQQPLCVRSLKSRHTKVPRRIECDSLPLALWSVVDKNMPKVGGCV